MINLAVLILRLLGGILLVVTALLFIGYRQARKTPRQPAPKDVPSCTVPGPPDGIDEVELTIDRSDPNPVTGGWVTGTTIHVQSLDLDSSLWIVARGDIDIAGTITVPVETSPGAAPVDVTIQSLRGNVHLLPNAKIVGGRSSPGIEASVDDYYAAAAGGPGVNGGSITIVGEAITIDGEIRGTSGGNGGRALAYGETFYFPRPFGFLDGLFPSGRAFATGGCGGYGGDILLCASVSIEVTDNAVIRGSHGGDGGWAGGWGSNGRLGFARGGDAFPSGDIEFRGTGRTTMLTISGLVEAEEHAGVYGKGGRAAAGGGTGGLTHTSGGPARARGGDGAKGGDIREIGFVIITGSDIAGNGGDGGFAIADGGDGDDGLGPRIAPLRGRGGGGFPGGDARANGGAGGAPGKPGGNWGHGGSARAKGGDGGNGYSRTDSGGPSGDSYAEGGPSGPTRALPASSGPQPTTGPNPSSGGEGRPVSSAGR